MDGKSWLLDFGASQANAERGAQIIRKYGFTQMGFVDRPAGPGHEVMTYFLVNGAAPVGAIAGEDAIPFNMDTVKTEQVGGAWCVTAQGAGILANFGSNFTAALTAERIIAKYRFSEQCFVGRPHAPMTYFRR
jgi:hypothetical protein